MEGDEGREGWEEERRGERRVRREGGKHVRIHVKGREST